MQLEGHTMLEELKEKVYRANLALVEYGLVKLTWGNVSGIDRSKGLVVIKPSGVAYDEMKPELMVVVDLNGKVVEGNLRPSSDTPSHLVLYRHFEGIGGVVHTHSNWATSFAQAGRGIPALGTTHGDTFYGEVPCTRKLTEEEIRGAYEEETGNVIVETFRGKNPLDIPAVLVNQHGPFTWGKDPMDAVEHAVILEEVATMAFKTIMLSPGIGPMDQALLDKHYLRKHGANAYYGQK